MAYQLSIDLSLGKLPKEQHENYCWWNIDEMLKSDEVHLHSKWYLVPDSGAGSIVN